MALRESRGRQRRGTQQGRPAGQWLRFGHRRWGERKRVCEHACACQPGGCWAVLRHRGPAPPVDCSVAPRLLAWAWACRWDGCACGCEGVGLLVGRLRLWVRGPSNFRGQGSAAGRLGTSRGRAWSRCVACSAGLSPLWTTHSTQQQLLKATRPLGWQTTRGHQWVARRPVNVWKQGLAAACSHWASKGCLPRYPEAFVWGPWYSCMCLAMLRVPLPQTFVP